MREKIKKIIGEIFNLDYVPDNVCQKTFVEWDSLHHLQLVVGLETEFNISFEPEDIAEMKSINEIEEKIKALIN